LPFTSNLFDRPKATKFKKCSTTSGFIQSTTVHTILNHKATTLLLVRLRVGVEIQRQIRKIYSARVGVEEVKRWSRESESKN